MLPKSKRLILASGSPRRSELIQSLDISVDEIPTDTAEPLPKAGESAGKYVVRLALMKAMNVAAKYPEDSVIGADTVVVFRGRVIGKPKNEGEATRILESLRGTAHSVVTGIAVVTPHTMETSWLSTSIIMRDYLDSEIASYVESGEPFDKAGGYAVQDPEFHPAKVVEGCYLNVVGFPLCEVMTVLRRSGIAVSIKYDRITPTLCPGSCPLNLDIPNLT